MRKIKQVKEQKGILQGFVVRGSCFANKLTFKKRFVYVLAYLKCGGGRRQFEPQKLKAVKETIEILSVNTIYRRCSIWPPPTSIHFVYRLIMSCPTLGKIPGISRITAAFTCIHAALSFCVSMLVSYTRVFMYPQKWNSNGVRSGERGVQAKGPPRPIHLLPRVSFKWRHLVARIQAGAAHP